MTDHQFPTLTIIQHPLIQTKLTTLRDVKTDNYLFRSLLNQIASLMVYEVFRNTETVEIEVSTPLEATAGYKLRKEITLVPILRAGLGMVSGIQQLIPRARVGHIGLYRDKNTLEPVEYYTKFPPNIAQTKVILIDPMLATGGSASAALTFIKKRNVTDISFVCLVAAPEGVERIIADHPEVPIFTAALDRELNDHAYILPGLGDAGDRIYGTE
ncbi:uracil phosphoribosyltransferase [bacterium]|nr:uracil phosphoribosyltransferase [bacterium]MBU1065279.1 uracil phosphoribosyltransferase [bacterium]MBU1635885.1 uracil phosphoribosyltransferase [bacterium]MBU1874803.1 uracil phosphoribosyltransferase [bacterium]